MLQQKAEYGFQEPKSYSNAMGGKYSSRKDQESSRNYHQGNNQTPHYYQNILESGDNDHTKATSRIINNIEESYMNINHISPYQESQNEESPS